MVHIGHNRGLLPPLSTKGINGINLPTIKPSLSQWTPGYLIISCNWMVPQCFQPAQEPLLSNKSHNTFYSLYHIAENFRGRKLSPISWFCSYMQKFSLQNLRRGVLRHDKSEQSAKVFFAKVVFFTNLQTFSPSKVSRYTVYVQWTGLFTIHLLI